MTSIMRERDGRRHPGSRGRLTRRVALALTLLVAAAGVSLAAAGAAHAAKLPPPTAVDPVDPTVTQAGCVAGKPSQPTLTFASTPVGVSYSAKPSGPYSGGQTVTVTATVTSSTVYFPPSAPKGWTYVSSTQETYQVTFAPAPACGLTPQDPSVTQSSCNAAALTAPTLTLPSAPTGITYSAKPSGPYSGGQTVTVTATIDDPQTHEFVAPAPTGWTYVDATQETYQLTFAADPVCSGVAGVTSVAAVPTFADAECVNGAPTSASYTLPDTNGVRYTVNGRDRAAGTYSAADGSTVRVHVTATGQYQLTSPASFVHTFSATPLCAGVEPVSNSTTPPLADTGVSFGVQAGFGGGAVVLGIALLVAGRRRRITS